MQRNNFVGGALEQENEERSILNSVRQGTIAPIGVADIQRMSDKDEEDDSFGQGDVLSPNRSQLLQAKTAIKPGTQLIPEGTRQQQLGQMGGINQAQGSLMMDVDQFGPGLMMAPSVPFQQMTDKSVALSQTNNTQMLRLIQQYLVQQGYSQVASELEKASNVHMEEKRVTQFRDEVLAGNFEDIQQMVATFVRGSITGEDLNQVSQCEMMRQKREFMLKEQTRMIEYLLFEQKYMELMEQGNSIQAIQILQNELRERAPVKERLHELAQLLMVQQRGAVENQNGDITGLGGLKESTNQQQSKLLDKDLNHSLHQKPHQTIPMQHNEKEVANDLIQTQVNGFHHPENGQQMKKKGSLELYAPWWKGSGVEGRACLLDKVQQILQSNAMLQPNRLEVLMKQALSYQLQSCRFHNMHMNDFSLLSDHHCSTEVIPQRCIATMTKHKDQVWLVQFSNVIGDKLASVCKDNTICIWILKWQVEQGIQSVEIKCQLQINTKQSSIQAINWSNTSDRYIITAGKDNYALIWDVYSGKNVLKLDAHSKSIQSAVFSNNDQKVFTIGIDQTLIIWDVQLEPDMNGEQSKSEFVFKAREISRIKTKYYEDMVLQSNRLVSVNKQTLYCYNFTPAPPSSSKGARFQPYDEDEEEMTDLAAQLDIDDDLSIDGEIGDEMRLDQDDYDDTQGPHVRIIEVNDIVTAVCLSRDGQQLLVNTSMKKPRIELWDMNTGECLRKLRGHEQKHYILRPSFGGLNERLVICGSEDTNVCIWNKLSGELIARLAGHYQIVNSVSWSPSNHLLFASGSDDMTVKVWSVQEVHATVQMKQLQIAQRINSSESGATNKAAAKSAKRSDSGEEYSSDEDDEDDVEEDDSDDKEEDDDDEDDDEEGWGEMENVD